MEKTELNFMPNTTHAVFRKCAPDWTLPKYTMSHYDLSYIVEGTGMYTVDGIHYTVGPGDLLCSPPGGTIEAHTSPDNPMSIYSVTFHLKDFEGENVPLPISVKTHIGLQKDLIQLFNDLSSVWNEKQPGYSIKTHGVLMLILHRIYELCVFQPVHGSDDYRIVKAIRYIDTNYHKKIMVEKLAALTNLEPHYFNTIFKQKTGVSLHQYLIKTRIKNAYNLLQTGNHRLGEIAQLCGYRDVYHFYKQFKMVKGISPAQCLPRKDLIS